MASLPTGVEIHSGKIRISFNYRGTRCREILKGWVVNNSNIKKAGNLRALICSEIQFGTFRYEERFPESKSLTRFCSPVKSVSTFGELCDAFHDVKEIEISPSTMLVTKSVSGLLQRLIGSHTRLEDIQHNDILIWRKKLLEGELKSRLKGNRTVRTVNGFMAQLCRMLKFAHMSNYISHTPYENVKSLKKSQIDPDPLLKNEFEELKLFLTGQSLNLWEFAVFSGLRHGELTGLSWQDVDLNAGEVHVKRTITLTKQFGPPKTHAGNRTVQLLKPALEALKRQFLLTGHMEATEITFHHRERGKHEKQTLSFCFVPRHEGASKSGHYSSNTIKGSWERAMERAGIRHRSPYHSRHTYACWLLSAGANPSFIASQMGHENAQMVYMIYSKWIATMNNDQIGMLNEKLG
ncbi:phage integrase [Buttiauxella gaviniae ATCC 51604]|uniref:Phage integrase n=1 Tax=Buttiauxella gaviniae ATCC 51604 TaxID=1354253 RepID=A0A1B7HQJ7_9ENTR|nr:site-specific integrase [Buttiauxella gaviniae]OAT17912.1 phage integrase [Buttiauxella gaviniae ATCC 51604]